MCSFFNCWRREEIIWESLMGFSLRWPGNDRSLMLVFHWLELAMWLHPMQWGWKTEESRLQMKYLESTLGLCLTYNRGTPLFSFLRAERMSWMHVWVVGSGLLSTVIEYRGTTVSELKDWNPSLTLPVSCAPVRLCPTSSSWGTLLPVYLGSIHQLHHRHPWPCRHTLLALNSDSLAVWP